MNILLLHIYGFIGRNLALRARRDGHTVFEINKSNYHKFLDYLVRSDVIVYLIGNKDEDNNQELDKHIEYLQNFLDVIDEKEVQIPIFFISTLDTDISSYSLCRKKMEGLLKEYSINHPNPIYIFQAPEVFGNRILPNRYSTVATYVYNVMNNIEVELPEKREYLKLGYIQDICNTLLKHFNDKFIKGSVTTYVCKPVYTVRPCDLLDELYYFDSCRKMKFLPTIKDEFSRKLYATFISYLQDGDYMNVLDVKDTYTEFVRMGYGGTVGIKVLAPSKSIEPHYHDTRSEKISVLSGVVLIKLKRIDEDDVYEYIGFGDEFEITDIPSGYVHSFTNIGKHTATLLVWYSEEDIDIQENI